MRSGGSVGVPSVRVRCKANGEAGIAPGDGHALGCGGLAHHQAGGGEDALAVRLLDGRVHLGRQAKVVGGDDDAACHAQPVGRPSMLAAFFSAR